MGIAETISIQLGPRCSRIVVHQGGTTQLANFEWLCDLHHIVVISDSNVAALYLKPFVKQLKKISARVDSIVVAPGESSKCVEQAANLWNRLLDLKTDRQSTILALGGGVVGDLAGFVAATFARGVPLIQIPTSLLAQVDSSVGGKTGINLPRAKNMVGAFWQPQFVLIDPRLLSTLSDRDYTSGLAEVVKYGVIMDPGFFQFLEQNVAAINARDAEILTSVVACCCRLKAQIVREDETETSGRRAILNYGHTFGHAIENVFRYGTYSHGEAISIGMQCAARLAAELSLVDEAFVARQTNLLKAFNLPLAAQAGKENELVAAMHRDKKVTAGTLRLILPKSIGQVTLHDAPDDKLLERVFHS